MMHVHHGRVSLSRTLRFLSASERFSQSREIGKTAGIDAGRGHGPRCHAPAGLTVRAAGSPRLRRRCGPPWSTLRPPANGPADPREPCRGRGTGSVLGVRTEPAWLKFPPLCHPRSPGISTRPWRPCRPLWSGMRSASANRVGIYRTPRTYPRWPSRTGTPASRSRLLHLSSPVPMATPLSLTFSLTMSSAGRIFATPPLGNHPTPCSGSVHFRLGASCFSCLKTFQGD